MKHFPQELALDPLPYIRAFANPFVTIGVVMLVFSLLTRMALLSMADLSVVLPLTAVGYILSTLLGSLFLGEHVSAQHWMGNVAGFCRCGVGEFHVFSDFGTGGCKPGFVSTLLLPRG